MNDFEKVVQTEINEATWKVDLEKWLKIRLDKDSIPPGGITEMG